MKKENDKLSPIEIKNREFNRSPFGYSPSQVVQFLDQVAKTWEIVQEREKELHNTIQHLKKKIEGWEDREDGIKLLENEAKKNADLIEEKAKQKAIEHLSEVQKQTEKLKAQTEGWLAEVIEKAEQTEMKRRSTLEELRKTLDKQYSILNET